MIPCFGNDSHGRPSDNPISVLVELLRQFPALSSEEPEAILGLVSKLDETHGLGVVDYKMFVVRVLHMASGAVLRFFGLFKEWEELGTVQGRAGEGIFPPLHPRKFDTGPYLF